MKRKKVYGVCRTYFFNQCDREEKDPKKRRPCYMAYVGHGRTYQSKRFPIDSLGENVAWRNATRWRRQFAPLNKRTCDLVTKKRSK